MNPLVTPLLWGATILLAMLGIGRLVAIILRLRIPPGIAMALGFAIAAAVGAFADLAGLISRQAILLAVFAGLAALIVDVALHRQRFRARAVQLPQWLARNRLFTLLVAAAILLALLRVIGSVQPNSFSIATGNQPASPFNLHDDFHAYLVFPNQMLQTGSLGTDPFSERRLLTSLGGSYVWDAILLTQLPEENLHLLESGLGLILLLCVAIDLFMLLKLSLRRIAALCLLILMVLQNNMNISSFMIPAALMLALLWFLLSPPPNLWRNALLLALLAAAIAAAKSTLILPLAILLLAHHLLLLIQNRPTKARTLLTLLLIAVLTPLLLAPWMIEMNRSFGTPLYPLLGTAGRTPFPTPFPPLASLLTLMLPPILTLAAFLFLARRQKPHSEFRILNSEFSILLAWIAGLLLVAKTAGIESTPRLSFPFAIPAILFSLAVLTHLLDQHIPRLPRPFARIQPRWCATALLAGFAILHIPDAITLYATLLPRDLASALRGDMLFDSQTLDDMKNLQLAAPPGAPILARLAFPHLLDFERNPVDIIDWPGGYYVSPPPGMPFFQGPEPLRQYLLAHHLRYVAWSYAAEANFPRAHFAGRLTDPDPLIRHSAAATLDFQSNLEQLRRTSRVLYQDRQNALIDLASPTT